MKPGSSGRMLPIQKLATSPQKVSGVVGDEARPRHDAVDHHRAQQDGDDRIARNAQAKRRDERRLHRGGVGRLRAGDAFDRPLAEPVGVARDPLFQRGGHEGRGCRTRPRQDTDRRAQRDARDHQRRPLQR